MTPRTQRVIKPRYIICLCVSILLVIACPWASPVWGEERKKIAILQFQSNKTSEEYARIVRDFLEVRLYQTNSADILERNQIDIIARQLGLAVRPCTDIACAVKVGNLLTADMVVIGSVSKLDAFTISMTIIDVAKKKIAYADSAEAKSEKDLEKAVGRLAEGAGRFLITGTARLKGVATLDPAAYYSLGIIPGAGQLYAGNYISGPVFLGLFALSGAYTGYAVNDFLIKRAAYRRLTWYSPPSSFSVKYRKSRNAFIQANVAISLSAAIYLVNWLDILFFSKPALENFKNALYFNDCVPPNIIAPAIQSDRAPLLAIGLEYRF